MDDVVDIYGDGMLMDEILTTPVGTGGISPVSKTSGSVSMPVKAANFEEDRLETGMRGGEPKESGRTVKTFTLPPFDASSVVIQPTHTALYVGNMTWWTTDEDLLNLAQEAGVTEQPHLYFFDNKLNGKSRGCACIELQTAESAVRMKHALENREIHGRVCVVQLVSAANAQQYRLQGKEREWKETERLMNMNSTGRSQGVEGSGRTGNGHDHGRGNPKDVHEHFSGTYPSSRMDGSLSTNKPMGGSTVAMTTSKMTRPHSPLMYPLEGSNVPPSYPSPSSSFSSHFPPSQRPSRMMGYTPPIFTGPPSSIQHTIPHVSSMMNAPPLDRSGPQGSISRTIERGNDPYRRRNERSASPVGHLDKPRDLPQREHDRPHRNRMRDHDLERERYRDQDRGRQEHPWNHDRDPRGRDMGSAWNSEHGHPRSHGPEPDYSSFASHPRTNKMDHEHRHETRERIHEYEQEPMSFPLNPLPTPPSPPTVRDSFRDGSHTYPPSGHFASGSGYPSIPTTIHLEGGNAIVRNRPYRQDSLSHPEPLPELEKVGGGHPRSHAGGHRGRRRR